MDVILKYFPDLNSRQKQRFEQLLPLYIEWNKRINVISRKDILQLYERHVLHSLGIAKFLKFIPDSSILDVGTGGGFPGIPLAIYFEDVKFHLVDSIGKKIKVVTSIRDTLELKNVTAEQIRAEQLKQKYDFIISRAVTRLPEFVKWVGKNILQEQRNTIANGIIYLKGGDLRDELKPYKKAVLIQNLSDYFVEDFFETKMLVYLPQ